MKIKQIKLNKKKFRLFKKVNKKKAYIVSGVTLFTIIAISGLMYAILTAVNSFFASNELVFNKPIEITLNKPVEIKERKIDTVQVVKVIEDIPDYEHLETDIEKYICDKWGVYDCKVALAVAKAESGLREDAININTNNTIDLGIFQINSIHYTKEGCSLKEVSTAKGNVDCAYQIWEAQGWTPWVVFNTGAFKNTL